MSEKIFNQFLVTGVGSLPHPNSDSALKHVFQYDIPFVPQLPRLDNQESMLFQSLDGFPGITLNKNGTLNLEESDQKALTNYFPHRSSFHALKPFIFELRERESKVAKFELAGPFTCFYYLTSNRKDITLFKKITDFIIKRASSIIKEISFLETIYFQFDEPGFCHLNDDFSYEAYRYFFKSLNILKKPNLKLGIHCCSNTHWNDLMKEDLQFVSFDSSISLLNILKAKDISNFLNHGELFAGIIPTSSETNISDVNSEAIVSEFITLSKKLLSNSVHEKFIESLILTPACGLGYKKITETFLYLEKLKECQTILLKKQEN